jgi:hypothetical protein
VDAAGGSEALLFDTAQPESARIDVAFCQQRVKSTAIRRKTRKWTRLHDTPQQLQQAVCIRSVRESRGNFQCVESGFSRRDFDQILQRGQHQAGTCCGCGLPCGEQIRAGEMMMIGEPQVAANLQAQ